MCKVLLMSHVPTELCVQSGTSFVKNKCITEPLHWHVSGSPMFVKLRRGVIRGKEEPCWDQSLLCYWLVTWCWESNLTSESQLPLQDNDLMMLYVK